MSKEFNIHVIAHQFIKHYYGMLAKNPSELHKFYKEDSCFMHSESLQEGVTVTGIEDIQLAVSKLNLIGLSMDLSNGSVDAQPVANGGVLVVVTGHYTPAMQINSLDAPTPKAFVQTFYLTAKTNQAYYVSNSVFRLLSIDEPKEDQISTVASIGTNTVVQQPVIESALVGDEVQQLYVDDSEVFSREEATIIDLVASTTNNNSVNSTFVTANNQAATVQLVEEITTEETEQPIIVTVPVPLKVPEEEPPIAVASGASKKLNYSDIVKKLAGVAAVKPASSSTHVVAATSNQQQSVAKTNIAVAPTNISSKSANNAPPNKTANFFSVYIKQLPEKTTQAELHNLFSPFGTIVGIDMLPGRAFAFVKFESSTSMKNAVAAANAGATSEHQFMLHGQVLKVEERNATRTSSSSSSTATASSSVALQSTGGGGGGTQSTGVSTENTKQSNNQGGSGGRHRDRGHNRAGNRGVGGDNKHTAGPGQNQVGVKGEKGSDNNKQSFSSSSSSHVNPNSENRSGNQKQNNNQSGHNNSSNSNNSNNGHKTNVSNHNNGTATVVVGTNKENK